MTYRSMVIAGAVFGLATTAAIAAAQVTVRDLQKAYQGESAARVKYMLEAKRAEKDHRLDAARLFRAAATAEGIHARNHRAVLTQLGGTVPTPVGYGQEVGTTRQNIQEAIGDEHEEHVSMYPKMISIARTEKQPAAIRTFTYALNAEAQHETLFRNALASLDHNPLPASYSVCPRCGATYRDYTPDRCPTCGTPGTRFLHIR